MTTASDAIPDLVERFRHNIERYHAPDYNETQVRREFIDPLFAALGWDVGNRQGVAPQYQEVIHEASVRVRGAVRSPDYCFRVGPQAKFYVEAKKPAVDIRGDISPAYQLRRYAWSAKLPLSILTDFEEFSVYEGRRVRPQPADSAATSRVLYVTYDQYAQRWDEIASVFSREAVWRGDYDRYAETTKRKRGTQEVDDAFLAEIENWRLLLARNIALRNANLSVRDLNYAVQKIIDRIIFLRICEDREIEPYERLKDALPGAGVYGRLQSLFQRADERYNSGLFHFGDDRGRAEDPDTLTPALDIDDKLLRDIIGGLYYPDCPYEFSVLSTDILGNVYERFLGSVIRLTPAHRAVVEQKPEVRKAGGVYYTPRYIVDYIVAHTVGELVKGRTPNELSGLTERTRGAPLRVLDPACGSGSFLLGAYQYLLDYYRNWYAEHPLKGGRKEAYQGRGDQWLLTTEEKKRILRTHIYGVDIDSQAVEVTKLSLLLKVLEGESQATLGQTMPMWQERALPDLSENIKCGNSLIGYDYLEQASLLDDEEMHRVNPFDWKAGFPDAMAAGGFDAVIGNPPYIRIQTMKQWAPKEVAFYKQAYASASKGNYDIYVVFAERGLSLLRPHGLLGFILPHKFFNAKYGEALRGLISRGKHLAQVVHFGDQQVFSGATTYTCLMFLAKEGREECYVQKVSELDRWLSHRQAVAGKVSASRITTGQWNLVVGPGAALFHRLAEIPTTLLHVTERIFQGLKTGADKVYIVDQLDNARGQARVYSRHTGHEHWIECALLHPLIKGGDSKNYSIRPTKRVILFPYAQGPGHTMSPLSPRALEQDHPRAWAYLSQNREYLQNREHGKMKGPEWYAYTRNQALDVMSQPKVFTPDIAPKSSFSLDATGDVFFTGGVAGGYGIVVLPQHTREYVLGLLNSQLLEWMLQQFTTQMRGGWYSYEARYIRDLPIRTIDFDDSSDVARHDRMVSLVERMLDLHKRLAEARTPNDKTLLQRQIDATDGQIDRLVYELYDLTEEEIAIVEEATG